MCKKIIAKVLTFVMMVSVMTSIPISAAEFPLGDYSDSSSESAVIQSTEGVLSQKTTQVTTEGMYSLNTSVSFENVKINDEFWLEKIKTNILVSIPKGIKEVEDPDGGIPNFVEAAKQIRNEPNKGWNGPMVFQDSDVYKMVEAMSYALSIDPQGNQELIDGQDYIREKLEEWIPKIEGAQEPNGYLDTYFTLQPEKEKFMNFWDHELYCAGHFIEAAVAHYRMTDKQDPRLYNVAVKLADHLDAVFGPEPKRKEVPGHEEVELALVKLSRLVDEVEGAGAGDKYWQLAKFFLDGRGDTSGRKSGYSGDEYSQDHKPIIEQTEAVGHAVRGVYQFTGMADVAAINGDERYMNALTHLWNNVVEKKMYIIGGIGSTGSGEAFGNNYELPNSTAYCETCAAIGNAIWNQRMNLAYEDAKFIDVMERSLYNNILSGVNLAGDRFYYHNVLESSGGSVRPEWFACACCPPNLMRVMASLGGYIYTKKADNLFVNLYIGNKANINLNGKNVEIEQVTNYPWEESVSIKVNPSESHEFTINVRIPDWGSVYSEKTDNYTIKINSESYTGTLEKGYVSIRRTWSTGDLIELDFPMEVLRQYSHPNVVNNRSRVALQRGPIVYAFEGIDNGGKARNIVIEKDVEITAEYKPDVLNGVVTLSGTGKKGTSGNYTEADFIAVPYYAWNNRGAAGTGESSGEMVVWTREAEDEYKAETIASSATPSTSACSSWESIKAINDRLEPVNSGDRTGLVYGNWPSKQKEWVQYDFNKEYTVNYVDVYWFSDGGGIKAPGGWKLLYWDDTEWKEVEDESIYQSKEYGVALNQYNTCKFKPVSTTKLRIEILAGTDSTGMLEWKVNGDQAADSVIEIKPVEVTTQVGVNPVLADKVTATFESGATRDLRVAWDAIDLSKYAQEGIFEVEGTVESTEIKAKARVTVIGAEQIKVKGVNLDKSAAVLQEGNEVQLIATIIPFDAADKTITWSSSKEDVAKVDKIGKVTALKVGTAIITVTTADGSFTAECIVTVTPPSTPGSDSSSGSVTGVTLGSSTASVTEGQSVQLKATVAPDDATNKAVTWSSSDQSVATVDQTGKVTGVKAGTTTITVTAADKGLKATCLVTVTTPSTGSGGSSSGGGGSSTTSTVTIPVVTVPVVTVPVVPAPAATTGITQNKETTQVSISLTNGTTSKDGVNILLSVKPYVQQGRTMAGIRDVATILQIENKNIVWNNKNKEVVIKAKDKEIRLVLNQKYAVVNDERIILDIPAQIRDGRTVLPIAQIARLLDVNIQFDEKTKEVTFEIKK